MSAREDAAWLAKAFADAPPSVRILKIGEEFGEAVQAFIGVGGWNHRKGIHATDADVEKELADVAVTALIALGIYTDDPMRALEERLDEVRVRHIAATL